MSFLSLHFLLFLLVLVALVHTIGARVNLRNNLLLGASYYFYMCWDWRFAVLLLINTMVNYFAAKWIYENPKLSQKKLALWIALFAGIGVLALFKYANFFIDNLSLLISSIGLSADLPLFKMVLPIGISFYTFQSLSYTLDVYRGKSKACTSFRDFALFVSFFPSILSGPITRSHQLLPQIQTQSTGTSERIESGLFLLVRGFIKKIAFADILAVQLVIPAFANPSEFSWWFLLIAVYAYSFQIYMDLSGYTDIARGSARLIGFELPENFNQPYLADSISNFWQRWHISMSGFFRDYLYFSVGGSKYGNVYINLLITFVAIGMWHGAGWNFVAYGLVHGSVVCVERFARSRRERLGLPPLKRHGVMWIMRVLIVFNIVAFSRILFRSSDLSSAVNYVTSMAQASGVATPIGALSLSALVLSIALHYLPVQITRDFQSYILSRPAWQLAIVIVAIAYALIALASGEAPFVYFQF